MRLKVVAPDHLPTRPITRADCLEGGSNAMRPCPWVSCRHHLGLDVADKTGTVKRNGEVGAWDSEESCALDVAERGPETLEEVGRVMGLTRERVRQIEELAFAKMRRAAGASDDSDGEEPDEEKLEAIRDMLEGITAASFASAPIQAEPIGVEEGPQGTFVVPDRIEPAEGIRRMFHKTMDAHLRDRAEREARVKGLPPPKHAVRVMSSSDSSDEDGEQVDERTEASQRARRGKRTALRAWTKKDQAGVDEWSARVRFKFPLEPVRDASGEILRAENGEPQGYREYVPPSDRPPIMTPGFGPADAEPADDDAESGVFAVKKPKRAKKPRRSSRRDGTKPGFGSAEVVADDAEMLLDLLDF